MIIYYFLKKIKIFYILDSNFDRENYRYSNCEV